MRALDSHKDNVYDQGCLITCIPYSAHGGVRVRYSGGSATDRTEGICVVLLQTLTSDWH